jgi:hypothetical protein
MFTNDEQVRICVETVVGLLFQHSHGNTDHYANQGRTERCGRPEEANNLGHCKTDTLFDIYLGRAGRN